MAMSELWASFAAESKSVPGSKVILVCGSLSRSAASGEVGNQMCSCQTVAPLPGGMMALPPGGSTCAEPPPEIMPTSAWPPIMAMLRTREGRMGRTELRFFKRTMLFSSTCWATSNPSAHRLRFFAADRRRCRRETPHKERAAHDRQFQTWARGRRPPHP